MIENVEFKLIIVSWEGTKIYGEIKHHHMPMSMQSTEHRRIQILTQTK